MKADACSEVDMNMTGLQIFFFVYFGIWLLPVICGLSCNFYRRTIRPALISRSEIRLLAQQLIAKHGINALEHARHQQDQAFAASDRYVQGKWRRITSEIERQITSENRR